MKRQVIEVLSGKGNTSALTTNDLFILVNEIMDDIYVTGGTYSNGTAIFTNNSGGTFNVTGFYNGGDIFVTGGTYNSTNGIATFTNNSGGTFNVTGFNSGGVTKEKFQDNYFSGDLIVLPNTPIFIYYLTNNGQILMEGEDDDYVVDGNEITLNYTLTNKKIIVVYEY
jgi:hypothetical protein